MSTTTTGPATTGPAPSTPSATARVLGLARANLTLLLRNKLTAGYALVLPLLPLALLLVDRGNESLVLTSVSSALLMAFLFPVFYNLLSATVTRRDELVLKRMRTGEVSDVELLVSLALPGAGVAAVMTALAVPVSIALGAPVPTNPLLYVVLVVVGIVMFTAFAFWTAAWTRNAEAAQMTSFPVIFLAILGSIGAVLPERAARVVELTPGAAMESLIGIGWLGLDDDRTLSFAETWAAAAEPTLVMVAWAVLALVLAQRSMRWEPRH
ncbi:ABC transporter permease [Nocardioides sp. CFH 31398]|uniref:ABC transporter permease n=1 Tax=Nocardioides sp. CFH 31398 TaxID=2919579 RepID=UPI001F057A34|nr:ABC transporter permease [Nocardioides sp. CFH 31398]MCH1867614.1 ABC transporter permease [Nocardioides sp. CFH 31398]